MFVCGTTEAKTDSKEETKTASETKREEEIV